MMREVVEKTIDIYLYMKVDKAPRGCAVILIGICQLR